MDGTPLKCPAWVPPLDLINNGRRGFEIKLFGFRQQNSLYAINHSMQQFAVSSF